MPTKKSRRTVFRKERFFASVGYEPFPGQLEIHRSKASRRVVACGVRWGKTKCAAMEGLAAAMEPKERSVGWVVAPTYDLAERVFREIQIAVLERLRHRVVSIREHERRITLRNMAGGVSEIRAKTADNPVSLLGEGLDWLIVDEAARLKPTIWESHLTQRLLDKRGWALLISTPRGKGWFYSLYQQGMRKANDTEAWNHPSWTNPHLDRDLIEAERERLPERVFQQEYGAQFVEGAGSVFRNVRECATGTWHEPEQKMLYYIGLDVARVQDYTVVAVLDYYNRLVAVDRFRGLGWSQQVGRIKHTYLKYGCPAVLMDTTGSGDPLFEMLWINDIATRPYVFTNRSKRALIDLLAIFLERKKIVVPKPELWPEGIDELESYEYSVTETGTVRSSAPSGQHDDCVTALALALWNRNYYERPYYVDGDVTYVVA